MLEGCQLPNGWYAELVHPGTFINRHVSPRCRSIEYVFHMLSLAFHLSQRVLFHLALPRRDSV